jgi:antitoxin ParD1/3/4
MNAEFGTNCDKRRTRDVETFNITLPDDVAEIVKERAAERGFVSETDFLQALVTRALDQEDRDQLEAMLIEGLESGPPIEATEEFWREFKQELNLNYRSKGVART